MNIKLSERKTFDYQNNQQVECWVMPSAHFVNVPQPNLQLITNYELRITNYTHPEHSDDPDEYLISRRGMEIFAQVWQSLVGWASLPVRMYFIKMKYKENKFIGFYLSFLMSSPLQL